MRLTPTLMAIVVSVATFGGTDADAAKPSKADRKKAIRLFKKSQDAYQAGSFRKAADLLEQAYALDPNPVLMFNLARALESAGDIEGTVAAYKTYLEEDPKARDRAAIEQRIQNLEAQLKARDDLRKRAEDEEKRRKALEKAPPPGPPPPPPPPPPTTIITPRDPSPWPWVVLGVGALGAASGGLLGAMASGKSSTARDEPVQETAASLDDSAHSLALGANLAYGIGGAIVLGGLIWGIVDLTAGGTETTVSVTPMVSSDRVGIAGRF